MTLREIINELDSFSEDLVIFATRDTTWQPDMPAALVLDSDTDLIGVQLEDLSYFLEVEIAKEVVQVWREWNHGEPAESQKIDALIYYADNDAYIAI